MNKYRVYYSYGHTNNWTDTIEADEIINANGVIGFYKNGTLVKMYSHHYFIYVEALDA